MCKTLLEALLVSVAAMACTASLAANELRTTWFENARFGMFIHWGVYSVLGRGEWVMHNEHIPVQEYETYVPQWKAENYNPGEWVKIAKDAGMRYMVLTSKHHDGFALFASKEGNYNSASRGPHKDLVRGLVDACNKAKMPVMFYHSWLDWHHPLYGKDMNRFVPYVFQQVRELCTNYGPIAGIWFDGEWQYPASVLRSDEMVAMIRKLQPKAVINDRLGNKERGTSKICDFYCAEQLAEIESFYGRANKLGKPWEACMTIGAHHWGYNANETEFKSAQELTRTLVKVACAGGNLLLNVGPMPDGTIQVEFVERLRAIGKWLKTNGRSIYGTQAGPVVLLPSVRSTCAGDTVYLHVWDLRGTSITVSGLPGPVRDVRLLADRCKLPYKVEGNNLTITVPSPLPDPVDTVIRVVCEKR